MPGLAQSSANTLGFCLITGAALTLYALRQVGIGITEHKKTKEEVLIERNDERPKVVVITGCDTGFGKLMAEAWCDKNKCPKNDVVVALTLTEKGAALIDAYNEDHEDDPGVSPIVAIRCDVTSNDDVAAAKSQIETLLREQNAVLYAIVNNAGILSPGDFVFYNDLTIPKKVMDVNFFGQLAITQALLPAMLSTSKVVGGKIINISSVCGTSANPGNSMYCASKFAVEAWTASLRIELQGFNIQVATIRSGAHATAIQTAYFDNYIQNFESSSDQIQTMYGGSTYSKTYLDKADAAGSRDLSKVSPPSEMVDTVTEILVSGVKLKPYYWVGTDANTFFKALSVLPTSVVEMLKSSLFVTPPQGPKLPPPDTVAYVTIRVRDMERSLKFYQTLGFEPIGPREGSLQFVQLNPSDNGTWESLVLLREDTDMPERGKCHHQGMTRLCLLTSDMNKTIEAIKAKQPDIEPYAPMCETKSGQKIKDMAYRDPDGFIVYFVEFQSVFMSLYCWWIKKKLPCLFHWTLNVSDSKLAMAYFEKLGFQTMSDQTKDEVLEDLLPAFRLEPSTTVIEWIRLCNLPKGGVIATIMEWASPKSVVNATSASNAMTLSVTDVQKELERAKEAGLAVDSDQPSYQKLPIYGEVLVGKAYLEKGSCPIEYCCFSNQKT